MTSVLGLVLISMSACLMPKSVPQGLGATPEGHPVEVEHQQRWQRKVDKLPFREAHLHTRRTLHGTVGGGLEGGPVVDSLRVGRSRVSRVLAHRGGASADLGGANKTVGRSNARGRPGEIMDNKTASDSKDAELKALFKAVGCIPFVTEGTLHTGTDGKVEEIRLSLSQKDCKTNTNRKFQQYIAKTTNGWRNVGKPTHLLKTAGIFPSPSGNLVATILNGDSKGDIPVCHIVITKDSEILTTISTEGKHAKMFTADTFGGFSWSADEKKIAYIADPTPPKLPNYFEEKPISKKGEENQKDEKSEDPGNAFQWKENWGEILYDAHSPKPFIVDIEKESVEMVASLPQDVSFGQVIWTPDGKSIICVGWPEKPRRLGITFYNSRKSSLYLLNPTTESDAKKSSEAKKSSDNKASESRSSEPKTSQSKASESKASESKAAESQASESKSSEPTEVKDWVILTPDDHSALNPRFSPDGKSLAYLATDKVWFHHSTSRLRVLSFPPPPPRPL